MKRPLTIAIDGPAGAGKSTVARLLARKLGYTYIDSGAMYRAVALLAQRNATPAAEQDEVAALARAARIGFAEPDTEGGEQRVLLNGEDITASIRTPEISSLASQVSAIPGVRSALVQQQQGMGIYGGVVMEGRDIGTVVFPHAEVKVFLTASSEERARRRHQDLLGRGNEAVTLNEVLADQEERDRRDETRPVSPLTAAPDALLLESDGRAPAEIVAEILSLVDDRQGLLS